VNYSIAKSTGTNMQHWLRLLCKLLTLELLILEISNHYWNSG